MGSLKTLPLHAKLHLRVLEFVMDSVPGDVYIDRHLDVAIMF